MCCFSQPVELVSDTNIFARSVNGRQFLVYSMAYAAAADLAMVLPLPVPPNPPEDAVRFINLERYPTFFDDLCHGFPVMVTGSLSADTGPLSLGAPKLRVHDVGSFEASFVPRLEDFDRLDERFRIPRQVWDRLPAYRDYGFAVFKLKGRDPRRPVGVLRRLFGGAPSGGLPKPRQVHPMAFEFPRRNLDLLYFPTVHVHDRKIHPDAMFDHTLYCQSEPAMEEYLQGWEKSYGQASAFMDIDRAEGVVAPNHHCWRRPLVGRLENKDTLVGRGGSVPAFSAV
ncbi:MAG TPA: hypothetical protein VKD71_06370 [Gemmataceae bacterium]|nr:hypothetical protein [Gemmataceae bacterium]